MSEDESWSVVAMSLADTGEQVTVVGNLAGARTGEVLRLTGRWTTHPRFGRRFEAQSVSGAKPATREGMEKYLSSGLVKGIGKELASRLVRRFGLQTLDAIESGPEKLREVEGIGPQRSLQIVEAWRAQRNMRDLMVFLQSYGVSTSLAVRIHKQYGENARAVIERNPYRLAEDIPGVGFCTADKIALKLDGSPSSPHRLKAGVLFTLREMSEEGHTVVPRALLAEECARLLGLDAGRCMEEIDALYARGETAGEDTEDGRLVGLPSLVAEEAGAASLLAALAAVPFHGTAVDAEARIAAFERKSGILLSDNQKKAVHHACTDKALVITGGPGTGKTTLLKAILFILEGIGRKVLLCAPTGRAAKRMAEAAGREAKTIHRLLEYSPQKGGFVRGRESPLSCDALIADEASMIDVPLFHQLLQALPPEAQLILVGDKDQLPSVGPGNVLGDIIGSAVLPVVLLTEVFRQAGQSSIVRNAHRINGGEMPLLSADDASDFFFIERNEPGAILETLKEVVGRRIPGRFGLDPRRDVQVLTPMQKGDLGAVALNRELQAVLNPVGPSLTRGGTAFRAGDRVMQLRNDYERGVFNGDIGGISRVEETLELIRVRFDDREILYEWKDLDEIAPAYACTIHKAQGSEFPAVVIVLHTQAYVLLARNLLYTAVTRGRRLTVIVGSRKALAIAVKNASAKTRFTRLAERLKKGIGVKS